MRRNILTPLALWILITASTERRRKDFALVPVDTAADIRLPVLEVAPDAIYARDFFVLTVVANVAVETLFLVVDRR